VEEQRQLAAQEAVAMPDLSSREQSEMKGLLEKYHLREENIRPDGNCLYVAFASQLNASNTSNEVNFASTSLANLSLITRSCEQ
jgi:hypothetical protein